MNQNSRLHDLQQDAVKAAENKLKSERRRHQMEKATMEKTIADLGLRMKKLSADFEDVNKKLIANLPKSHVSDREVADAYEELCQTIEDWIDANCADIDSPDVAYEHAKRLDSTRLDIGMLLDDGNALNILEEAPECKDHILTKLIMRFLFNNLLRMARWLPGLSTEQEQVLQIAMDNLPHGPHDKGFQMRNSWRYNTFQSLAASPKLQKLSSDNLEQLAFQLSNIIEAFLDHKDEGSDKGGLRKLIDMAADLARIIRLCPVQYYFIYAFSNQMSVESRGLQVAAKDKYNIIDTTTGTLAREEHFREVEDGEVVGQDSTVILPSLVKLNSDGTVVRLVKGTLLVDFDVSVKETTLASPTIIEPEVNRKGCNEEKEGSKEPPASDMKLAKKTWAAIAKQ